MTMTTIDVTIYLRDLWMHRIDANRALSLLPELSADHDGRIVADIVVEWARRHGKPFILHLAGPAGGTYATDPGRRHPGAAERARRHATQ
jgi:hypothetical protein